MPFPEPGLAGDHSEHFARDLARFVLPDVYLKVKGNCYYIAGWGQVSGGLADYQHVIRA